METNLDDVSAEVIAHCTERLLAAGALDVFSVAVQMKKNRPGTLLSVLCEPAKRIELETILFQETMTLGIRRHLAERAKLERENHSVDTSWGTVQGKLARLPNGQQCFSPEYEACRTIAVEKKIAVREVFQAAQAAWRSNN